MFSTWNSDIEQMHRKMSEYHFFSVSNRSAQRSNTVVPSCGLFLEKRPSRALRGRGCSSSRNNRKYIYYFRKYRKYIYYLFCYFVELRIVISEVIISKSEIFQMDDVVKLSNLLAKHFGTRRVKISENLQKNWVSEGRGHIFKGRRRKED